MVLGKGERCENRNVANTNNIGKHECERAFWGRLSIVQSGGHPQAPELLFVLMSSSKECYIVIISARATLSSGVTLVLVFSARKLVPA
jgi:hypothetical protein